MSHISPTAIEKEEIGSVYKVKIAIEEEQLTFKESQTGERRLIDFFLEPLVKYLDESLKLR